MKVAVLGSTGYLGRRIVRAFADAGVHHDIYCIHRPASDISVFDDIRGRLRFCLSTYSDLKECIADGDPFDVIINASCSYMRNATAEAITESNLIFPLRAINMAVENPGSDHTRFISLGTGLPDRFNIYTYAKSELNSFGRFWGAEMRRIHFINIEMQNFMGPFEPSDRFVHMCIDKMRRNEDVPLTTGIQRRDFFYVDDVISAIMLIANYPEIPRYMDVPLGSGQAPTIREFVTYIKNTMNSESKLLFGAVPDRGNEPSICADLSAYHMLGGSVRYTWQEGIVRLLEEEGII